MRMRVRCVETVVDSFTFVPMFVWRGAGNNVSSLCCFKGGGRGGGVGGGVVVG